MVGQRIKYGQGVRATLLRQKPTVLSLGHSTQKRKDFIALLQAHGVRQLVDVRTIPRSRHNPQFNRAILSRILRRSGIGYRHMAGLGGLRHSRRDSINTGWRNKSFRGYADYMQTPDFRRALRKLIGLARQKRVAVMCAEAVPWHCHRSLIADALLVRGIPVAEIQSRTRTRPHLLTTWARVEGTRITYPGPGMIERVVRPSEGRRNTNMIQLRRVYDKATSKDGRRFLVERLWPRGIKKSELRIDAWLKDVGPSTSLRKWFSHDPKKWEEFRHRYFGELKNNVQPCKVIQEAAEHGRVTLVYSSHDTEHNNAVALKEFLETKLNTSRRAEQIRHKKEAA